MKPASGPSLLDFVPQPPAYALDWQGLTETFEWVARMEGCPQDPQWHAEGNVWIHTRMVLEELLALPAFRALDAPARELVFLAALLHDVAKPECTRTEPDGRITSRGHSRRGAIMARALLWQMDIPFERREHVAQLVASHQVPYLLDRSEHAEHIAIELSLLLRCDYLAVVTMADARGRTAADKSKIIDSIWFYEEICKEAGVWGKAHRFQSDHQRFLFGRDRKRTLHTPAYDDCRATVTVMSGLPGAGKSHWIERNAAGLPRVSLDAIRAELGIAPTQPQGTVVQKAYARGRELLRAGEPFVWNATNVGRDQRKRVIDLLADYKARVRIVYVEAPYRRLMQQNSQRKAAVPRKAMDKLFTRWTVPTRLEAHELVCAGPTFEA